MPKTGARPLSGATDLIAEPSGKPVHLLVVAFDYDRNTAVYFRSSPTGDQFGGGASATVSLAEAVHASTNAPVNYFDAPATLPDCVDRFWDGGLTGNNNPSLLAAVEAVCLGASPSDIRVLSIGTGTVRLPLANPGAPDSPFLAARPASTLVADLRKFATAILDDPPDFATFVVHCMTGGDAGLPIGLQSRIVRMNALISPRWDGSDFVAPDGWSGAQFQYFRNIDVDAIKAADVAYIDDWCTTWILGKSANQPIRMDYQTLRPIIGSGTFAEAKTAWQAFGTAAEARIAAGLDIRDTSGNA